MIIVFIIVVVVVVTSLHSINLIEEAVFCLYVLYCELTPVPSFTFCISEILTCYALWAYIFDFVSFLCPFHFFCMKNIIFFASSLAIHLTTSLQVFSFASLFTRTEKQVFSFASLFTRTEKKRSF